MRCKTCHYSLANLTEHRCPECGTAFDPNDPKTFYDPVRAWAVTPGICFFLAGAGILMLLVNNTHPIERLFVVCGVVLFLVYGIRLWIAERRQTPPADRRDEPEGG